MFWALNLGVIVALILALRTPVAWPQVAAVAVVLALGWGGVPAYCRPGESLEALERFGSPSEPPEVPPGAEGYFRPLWPSAIYSWDDYRRTLAYLRRATGKETRVVNALRNTPFLTFNGPVGRITPLPADTGVLWLWQVDPGMEGAYVAAMEVRPRLGRRLGPRRDQLQPQAPTPDPRRRDPPALPPGGTLRLARGLATMPRVIENPALSALVLGRVVSQKDEV